MELDHSKIITATAKEVLRPLGLKQHRKSRTWYDDHGWWAIVVEFQPSSWSRGTYLNVAVSWMLYENPYWTFDVGSREQGFSPVESEDQFTSVTRHIATHAKQCVERYREQFSSVEKAAAYYTAIEPKNDWQYYEAAVIAGLACDPDRAQRHFGSLLQLEHPFMWQLALRYRVVELLRLLPDRNDFLDAIRGIALRRRTFLGLDDLPSDKLGLPSE